MLRLQFVETPQSSRMFLAKLITLSRNLFMRCIAITKAYNAWQLQNVPGITIVLWNTTHYNHLNYIYLKIFPLCNYRFLPATIKVLETFLEAILPKPFQLFRRILNDVINITIAPSLQCWFQSKEQVKISWIQVRRVWGMLQCCHTVLC